MPIPLAGIATEKEPNTYIYNFYIYVRLQHELVNRQYSKEIAEENKTPCRSKIK